MLKIRPPHPTPVPSLVTPPQFIASVAETAHGTHAGNEETVHMAMEMRMWPRCPASFIAPLCAAAPVMVATHTSLLLLSHVSK